MGLPATLNQRPPIAVSDSRGIVASAQRADATGQLFRAFEALSTGATRVNSKAATDLTYRPWNARDHAAGGHAERRPAAERQFATTTMPSAPKALDGSPHRCLAEKKPFRTAQCLVLKS